MSSTLCFHLGDKLAWKGQVGTYLGDSTKGEHCRKLKLDMDGSTVDVKLAELDWVQMTVSKNHLVLLVDSLKEGLDLLLDPEQDFTAAEMKVSLEELRDQVNEFDKHQVKKQDDWC